MIGMASSDCPTMMALGVNSRPRPPRTPWRLNRPNIRRPRTTVGIAIRLFSRMTASRFSGKSDKPIAIPIGSPNNDAITVDHPAVLTEVQTAAYTSRSAEKISENAVPTDCVNDPTHHLLLVDKKDRVTFDLVIRDNLLPLWTGDEVNELHCQLIFHMRKFLRIDGDCAIGIEQTLFTFEHNSKVSLSVPEGVVGSAIRECVGALLGGHRDYFSHALACRSVPLALWCDTGRCPDFFFLLVRARLVAAGDERRFAVGNALERFGRRLSAFHMCRVGRRADDDEIVVHNIAPVDAVTVSDELVLQFARVYQHNIDVARFAQFERLACAD